ncbi:OmpA family protein [Streptosporangium sandarakinum]|uniref:OmpA family protein n=1 Tax=Streptosporangium sandarakinum TaxID=1260955 RepID=UPI0037118A00
MGSRIVIPLVALLTASACALSPEAAPPTSAPPVATSPPATPPPSSTASGAAQDTRPALARTTGTMTPNLEVEVVGLNRVRGEHLIAQVRLTNTDSEKKQPWTGEMGDNTRPLGEIRWASGIGVLDARARTWILPYQPAGSPCLCSDQDRDGLGYFIDPGASVSLYAVMPAPSGNPSTTTVVTPLGPPMVDVPISDDPPVIPPGTTIPDPDAEPVTTVTRRLVTPSESPDESEETADDGTDLHVNLSSDVLFAVDKATLTPRAKAVLARTAKLIDASPGTTVRVEGHADSSGTDAINDPLSTRRARSALRALSTLVTRQGVTFQARGYGSRRPLYGNDTAEGRRRNRRVTVTFARPEPATATTPPTAPAPGATGLTGTGTADGQPISMEITGLRRLTGGLGLLTYRITNRGDGEAWFNELHRAQDWMSFKYQAASNVTMTDVETRRRYLPARLQVARGGNVDLYCACTDVSGVRLSTEKFAPGRQREFWSLFELPDTAATMKVTIASFGDLRVPVR